MNRRGLIVNADDLGIHPQINAGIVDAFASGVLTSATLLMTTPYLDTTIADCVRKNDLPVGIHLSLTLGKALAPASQVPDLIDERGQFKLSAKRLMLLGGGDRAESLYQQIRREIEAQLAAARDLGIVPTHVDSHQHVHMNPRIFAIVEAIAEHYGIFRIRFSRESLHRWEFGGDFIRNMRRQNLGKLAVARFFAARISPRLAGPNEFFGLMYSGHISRSAWQHLIDWVGRHDRVVEIGIHPGYCAPSGNHIYRDSGANDFIASPSRQAEHDLLADPAIRAAIASRGIRLMSYRDLD
ncbi:MAG TPA: ChbG/HpnK family deacetylase [Stellaceae bacterium]|jgi:predicted glycoside hydrolase/deacetylase ChbG (UPF0249 family)|nr:ChbG/HpnK family deacetylase [Stellaceae bacterium]